MDRNIGANVVNWTARILGLLFFAFISLFVVAHAASSEGLPQLWRESLGVQLDFVALFLMVVGGIAGWKWPDMASVVVLSGYTLWQLVEHRLPWPPSWIEIPLAVGVLYAVASWIKKRRLTRETAIQ